MTKQTYALKLNTQMDLEEIVVTHIVLGSKNDQTIIKVHHQIGTCSVSVPFTICMLTSTDTLFLIEYGCINQRNGRLSDKKSNLLSSTRVDVIGNIERIRPIGLCVVFHGFLSSLVPVFLGFLNHIFINGGCYKRHVTQEKKQSTFPLHV